MPVIGDKEKVIKLNLSFNQFDNLEFLKEFKNLKKLNLCSNVIKGVLALKDLADLECLDISFNRIDNIN